MDFEQIINQQSFKNDTTKSKWNALPFIENEVSKDPIIVIDAQPKPTISTGVQPKRISKKKTVLLKEEVVVDTLASDTTTTDTSAYTNILSPLAKKQQQSIFQEHSLKTQEINPEQFNSINPDWFTIILMVLIVAFTYLKVSYNKIMKQLFSAFFSNNVTNQIVREENILVQKTTVILSLIFYLSGGLFLYQMANYYNWNLLGIDNGFSRFVLFALILALVSPLKLIILRLLGSVFESNRLTTVYSFNIFLINNVLGVFLIPLIAIIAYIPVDITGAIIIIGLVIITLSFLYRLGKGLSIWRTAGHVSVFYFILYLCTLEIAPILILLKVARIGS